MIGSSGAEGFVVIMGAICVVGDAFLLDGRSM